MSNREFIHDVVLQVAVIIAFFAIMGAITSWNCARCDAALNRTAAALSGSPASAAGESAGGTEQEDAR